MKRKTKKKIKVVKIKKRKMKAKKFVVKKTKPKTKKKIGEKRKVLKKEKTKKVVKSKPLVAVKKKAKKITLKSTVHYYLNTDFDFYNELRALILKSSVASNQKLIKRIAKLGKIKLAITSGVFLNLSGSAIADLLIVGEDIDKQKLKNFLKNIEVEVGKEIIYVVMNQEEFSYRRAMFDRFLRLLLEGPHEAIIDKIGV